jgi:hypothetical protein
MAFLKKSGKSILRSRVNVAPFAATTLPARIAIGTLIIAT